MRTLNTARATSSAAYVSAAAAWIYGVYDRASPPRVWVIALVLALLVSVHLLAGLVIGWRSLWLACLLIILAVPAGARNGDADRIPVALAALETWLLPALLLLALGAWARQKLRSPQARRVRKPKRPRIRG